MAGKHALETPEQPKDRRIDPTTVTRALKHPAAAPTAVTVVAIALVMGMGWLNRTSEVGPASLATPLAQGRSTTLGDGDDGRAGGAGPSDTSGSVLATRGRRAVLVPTWMDLPLVTPALAVRPEAIETLIPGATPTTVAGTGSGGTGTGATTGTTSGTGTTAPGPGSGTTVTTAGTGGPTTAPPDTTATTAPPDTTATTAPPDTTEPPPTSDTTIIEPPTTDTLPTGEESTGGLLDVVDGLLDTVSPALEPLPLL